MASKAKQPPTNGRRKRRRRASTEKLRIPHVDLHIRMAADIGAAFKESARRDARPVSLHAEKALREWLRSRGEAPGQNGG